jgi:rare lipoprotein A
MERYFLGTLLGLVFSLAVAQVHPALASGTEEPGRREELGVSSRAEKGVIGTASYYAKRFHGRRTTSGERHRPEGFTAAHPSLPLGTKVRVVHLGTQRETVVRINDRCRKRKLPAIDLSHAAAREIGLLKQGRARVRIIPLRGEGQ